MGHSGIDYGVSWLPQYVRKTQDTLTSYLHTNKSLNMQVMLQQHMLAPFLPHADGLLWTSRHIQGLEGNLLGDKRFRDYILAIRVSLGYRFGYRFWHAVGLVKKRTKLESNSIPSQWLPRPWNISSIPKFARKHKWTNAISKCCKASLLVVHYIISLSMVLGHLEDKRALKWRCPFSLLHISKEFNPWNGAPIACKGIRFFLLPFNFAAFSAIPTPHLHLPATPTIRPHQRHPGQRPLRDTHDETLQRHLPRPPPQQEAKLCEHPPPTLELRTPAPKAIWWNINLKIIPAQTPNTMERYHRISTICSRPIQYIHILISILLGKKQT